MTRAKKGRTLRTPEQEREHERSMEDDFSHRFPVGSNVWYWTAIPFGPVKETTVREACRCVREGDSNAGLPVIWLTGIPGYVSASHIAPVDESRREQINPEVLA